MNSSSSSNVLNVGLYMRSYSDGFRVSPAAVHEMISRMNLWLETHMKDLCGVAESHGRHTVGEDDVTEFFSVTKTVLLGGD